MFYDFIYLAKGFRMRPKVRSTLNECSCISELIKRVGEKDKMRGFAEHLIGFPQRVY